MEKRQIILVLAPLNRINSNRDQAHGTYPSRCDSVGLVGVIHRWPWELESTFPNYVGLEEAKNDSIKKQKCLSMNAHSAGEK